MSGTDVTGAVLADRYRLDARVAVGGMGEVWRAQDTLLGRTVAVKTLKSEYLDDADFRARFRAEARHAGGLKHPGIASVHDFGESAETAWLVMELVDGEPLSALLRREGALSVDRTLDLVAQTAAALQAAHDGGVVHRDIKPGNLLVRADGVLKVTDFGIASAADAVPLTQTGTVIGTAYYLSPEQAAGRSGSPASDVYALGVVAYECLAGARPFPGPNPVAVALAHLRDAPPALPAHVPSAVRDLVACALAKNPADRFADAAAMSDRAAQLRAAIDDDACYPSEVTDPPTQVINAAFPEVRGAPEVTKSGVGHRRWRLPGAKARSARAAVRLAAALLVVLAVGLGMRTAGTPGPGAVPAADASASLAASAASSTAPSAAVVNVVASSYLGRPAAEVRAALADRGLVPRLAYDGSGTAVGTVSGVEPTGPLAVGTAVLLHVVPEPAPAPVAPAPDQAGPAEDKGPPAGKGLGGNGKGRGNR